MRLIQTNRALDIRAVWLCAFRASKPFGETRAGTRSTRWPTRARWRREAILSTTHPTRLGCVLFRHGRDCRKRHRLGVLHLAGPPDSRFLVFRCGRRLYSRCRRWGGSDRRLHPNAGRCVAYDRLGLIRRRSGGVARRRLCRRNSRRWLSDAGGSHRSWREVISRRRFLGGFRRLG